ncbi:MAG: aldo/keto reductase [Myxococcales bacterium]|nr:aldo/keto reductase [Myxococcales bacterium]
MEYRPLGRSGLKVSTLCLGTMTFGDPDATSFMHGAGCDWETSHAILDAALAAGVNFIDTADVYGQDGLAERVVGAWFARSGRRDEVVLATKFRFRMGKGPNGNGASRGRMVRCVEDSLRRLQTDRIDLYQIHAQDLDVPEDETLRAFDDLQRQGKILHFGCSNYAAYRLVESLYTSDRLRLDKYVTLQAQYSLAVRDVERELVPLCRRHGLGLLPWSPLEAGFLTGKFRKDQPPPPGSRLERWKERLAQSDTPRNWRTLAELDAVAAETGASLAAVALRWLVQKPAVTSVIYGARTLAQQAECLQAAGLVLTAGQMERLDTASAFELGYPYEFLRRVQKGW